MSAVPQFLKRLESRIAIALSRAIAAAAGVIVLSHHVAQTNGVQLGPGIGPFLFGPAFATTTGKVRVWVQATITGTTIVAGDLVFLNIQRNGVNFGAVAAVVTALTGAGATTQYALSAVFEDSVAPGTYSWQASISASAHTLTVPAGNVAIVVSELPG